MSQPAPPAHALSADLAEADRLRAEVSSLAERSRVGGLFYLAGWLLVAVASQGFTRHPGLSLGLAALFALLAAARFLLRPALAAPPASLRRIGRWHWGLLMATALVWGSALVWVMLDPAFETTRPAAVVCSILYATAYAHSYPMSLPGTMAGMGMIYLPAPLLAGGDSGGLAVQVALGIYALYLVATVLRSRREYLGQLQLEASLRTQRDRFEQLSQRDGLTGLLNHAEFATRLARAGEQNRRGADRLSLLLLDIDHFKQVNDRLGHLVGDRLLAAFALRMNQVFGEVPGASIGRWGGEEFAVLLPGQSLEAAAALARRLLESLREAPLLADGPRVSVSVGVGQLAAGANDPAGLLEQVDQALYRAKASGRDCVECVPYSTAAGASPASRA